MNVMELTASLVLDTLQYMDALDNAEKAGKDFADNLGSAGDATDDFGARVKDITGKITTFVKTSATVAAVASTAKYFWQATDAAATYGDSIDKNSQKLGLSAAEYQKWGFVLEHTGTNISTLTTAMRTLTNQADKGNAAFRKLGITQEDLKSLNQQELFEKTISGLQSITDTSERAVTANALLGRSYQELNPLLNMTQQQTRELQSQYDRLGGAMTALQVKQSAAYADAKTDLETAMQGFKNIIGSVFLEFNTAVVQGTANAIGGINRALNPMLQYEGMSGDEIDSQISSLEGQLSDQLPENVYLNLQSQIRNLKELKAAQAESSVVDDSRMMESVQNLAVAYQNTYDAIRESVSGYFGTFDEAAQVQAQSVETMTTNIQSQIEYNRGYAESIGIITDYANENGISMEGLSVAIASAGAAGKGYADAIAAAIQAGDYSKVDALVSSYEDLQASQEGLTEKLTDSTGIWDEVMAAAQGSIDNVTSALESMDDSIDVPAVREKVGQINDALNSIERNIQITVGVGFASKGADLNAIAFGKAPGFAGGIANVPYDNFPAILHEGERVLTKEENKAYNSGVGKSVVNNFYPQSMSKSDMDYMAYRINQILGGS